MDVLSFLILGLATGAIYSLIAQGLVLVYKASGIVNLAQGAFVMVGAYVYFEATEAAGLPQLPSVVLAVLVCAALGAFVQVVIMGPMVASSPLQRVIATLGVLVVLESIAFIRYGENLRKVDAWLPSQPVSFAGVTVGLDSVLIFGIGCVVATGLWLAYARTHVGRVSRGVAENPRTTASLGHSVGRIAVLNWAAGSALAGLVGTIIGPITFLQPTSLALLVVPGLAAALLGAFSSFPIALLGGLAMGVVQSLISNYTSSPGLAASAPFIMILIYIVWKGRGLPLRSHILDRLPRVGTGRVRPIPVAVMVVAMLSVILFGLNAQWLTAFTVVFAFAIIMLSIVVITGYAGQLSLAQYSIAGAGALLAARLDPYAGFVGSVIVTLVAAAVLGAILGLPALRTRGITLGIVTLCLAMAIYEGLLVNERLAGGIEGIPVEPPTIFGLSVDPLLYPERYTALVFLVFVVLALAVASLRRGAIGRRMLAVRSNERAAVASGINVYFVKIYAFALASAIAAIGGVLLAFMQVAVITNLFSVFLSLTVVGNAVVGGVGMIGGAILAAFMMPGGVVSEILRPIEGVNGYMPLIGGLLLLLALRFAPDGLFEANREALAHAVNAVKRRWGRGRDRPQRADEPETQTEVVESAVVPKDLQVRGLSVSFGGVKAVQDLDLTVSPGTVHGLIGPNGAGKTTVIDAVTGLVGSTGSISLDGVEIAGKSGDRRAAAGISRSFQSLELFSGLTVRENLAVASDPVARRRYLLDLVKPGPIRTSEAAQAAIRRCGLESVLDEYPDDLPFGQRKLVAIARAVATAPSVLLLDEPAAGLDDHETQEFSSLVRSLADDWGIAVLLVEHNVGMVTSVCDTVTVLVAGKLLMAGNPHDIASDPAVLEAYLGSTHDGGADVPAESVEA